MKKLGGFLGRLGARGAGPLDMQNLQMVPVDPVTPCSPLRGCGELQATASAAELSGFSDFLWIAGIGYVWVL